MEGKTINTILDIHTHRREADSEGKSIVNYKQLTGAPLLEGYYYSIGIHPWELTMANIEEQLIFMINQLPDCSHRGVRTGQIDRDFDGTSENDIYNADNPVGTVQLAIDHSLRESNG